MDVSYKKGKKLYDVEIFDETFKDVKGYKCPNNKWHCKFNNPCYAEDHIRFFDCRRNALRAILIYNLITSAIVVCIAAIIFFYYDFSWFKGIAFFIVSLVFLDILCTVGEYIVPKIRERLFYNKLKKAKRKQEKIKEAEEKAQEAKKVMEELQESKRNPNYKSVIEAEAFVNNLKDLSEEYNFGVNEEKIDICVEKLSEIIAVLKKDSSGYIRVAFLFEAYLPEFYNTLRFYADFIKANVVNQEYEDILTKCVDKFLNFLNDQKIEAIFDKRSIEIQFKSTARTLEKMIDKGENHYESKNKTDY
ncbi:MAG: hypothetical protein IJE05_04015 [Clostridia bacterium]|nr:hypothetical protein [Clostridia bacterium]